tara:strand:- start:123 stop:605 length:483 start_codon:yes stop_codon:yes gene_type:complete
MKKIFTTLTIILILSNLSCNSIDNSNKITEDQVKQTVSNFFASIEIGSELNTTDYITDDFKIVELGGPYTLDEFWALIAESQGENIAVSRKWDLSNWSISIDINSAHVSYKNNGTFVTSIEGQEVTTNPVWLESGYLVLIDGKLKIKYFQSEEVSDYLSK